jgi:hypothetical protein
MGYGKGAAQAAHAANKFAWSRARVCDPSYDAWTAQAGNQGFGTTIVLDAGRKLKPLIHLLSQVVPNTAYCGIVTDPTYPYLVDRETFRLLPEAIHTAAPLDKGDQMMCFRNEITCGYLFCDRGELDTLISQFPLLRNT